MKETGRETYEKETGGAILTAPCHDRTLTLGCSACLKPLGVVTQTSDQRWHKQLLMSRDQQAALQSDNP